MRALAVLALLLAPLTARADETTVAVAPVVTFTDRFVGDARGASVEELLGGAVDGLPGHRAIGAPHVREVVRRAARRDLEACEGEPGCLADVGRLCGAQVVLYAESGALAGDRVVYLKAVDAVSRGELGSTTLVLKKGEAEGAVRAAVTRLLAPAAYVGVLEVAVDVAGATVFIDGHTAGRSPLPPVDVPVGVHALRVTHPSYRDFVRWVDVEFERRTQVAAELHPYPVVGDMLIPGQRRGGRPPSPWLLAGFGAAVAVTAFVIAFVIPRGIDRDRTVTVGGPAP